MALEFGTSIIFTDPVAAEYGRVEASGEADTDISLQHSQRRARSAPPLQLDCAQCDAYSAAVHRAEAPTRSRNRAVRPQRSRARALARHEMRPG